MKFNPIVLFLLVLASVGQAQVARVEGDAPAYTDKAFKVYEQVNYLTGQEKLVVEGRIDEAGAFSFDIPTEQTVGLNIKIEGVQANLFVQPDAFYSVTFPPLASNKGRKLTDNQVSLEFEKESSENNINISLANIDRLVLEFSLNQAVDLSYRDAHHAITFKGRRPPRGNPKPEPIAEPDTLINVSKELLTKIQSFKKRIEATNARQLEDPFVRAYADYCIGGLELQAVKKRWEVYYSYLHELPVLRNNPEYARFANQFYGGLFLDAYSKADYRYSKAVNSTKDIFDLHEQLLLDLYMDDPNMAKVAMLINLQEVFFKKGWNRKAVEAILEAGAQAKEFSEFNDDFGYVAQNIGNRMKGGRVPNFKMLDHKNEFVSKSDFGDKYIYIGFFTTWSSEAYKEMQLMKKLRLKYSKDIEFISVSLDYRHQQFTDFVVANPDFDWTFLYGPSYDQLHDIFSIPSVPTYVLIDPKGEIRFDYTRKPSEGINLEFDKILRRNNRPEKVKVWDD